MTSAASSGSINDYLRPTTAAERTFSFWDMAGLWVSMVVGVPSYYLAGSLVDLGMTWWQGIATIVLANTILLVPLVLTGVPGTRYGISFPVLARSAFGIHGAHIPTLLRALVACGWFGIETWIGGQAIFLLLPFSYSSLWFGKSIPWLGTSLLELACFMVFWAAQVAVLVRGISGIRDLGKYSAPVLILLTSGLFCWAYAEAGGLGEMLSPVPQLPPSKFWPLFFNSMTATIGGWSGLALNIPDFTRYAKSQVDQIVSQMVLPIAMGVFTFVGLAVTSATVVIFGVPISNPMDLIGKIGHGSNDVVQVLVKLLAVFGIVLATVTTNVPANVVAPANALVNLNPTLFTFKRAALLTALIGIACQPWRIFKSSGSFVKSWLVGCSSISGPISGIMLTDYYIVGGMELDVEALYADGPQGKHYHLSGCNPNAIVALAGSIAPIIPGFLHQVGVLEVVAGPFIAIYDVSWFFGLFVAAGIYWFLSSCFCRSLWVQSEGCTATLEDQLLMGEGN